MTKIGKSAFGACGLTSINIPNSVTEIGESAFHVCWKLKNVTIPNSVREIREWAFSGCKALTSINIPESVRKIGNRAFYKCLVLKSVTIPNSVTEIEDWAFSGCENLKEIILFQTDPSKIKVTERSGLQKKKAQITLYVPKEGVAAFQKDPFWSECAAIKPITDDMIK